MTAAPNRLTAWQRTGRYVEKLTDEASWDSELAAAVGQLVAAVWLDADPLSAPARAPARARARADLHIQARDALRQIARIPGGKDITALHTYAGERFGDDADWLAQEVTAVAAPSSCGQTVAPFRLVTSGGECVGVTDATAGYYFDATDPVAVSLQQLIGRPTSGPSRTAATSRSPW